MAGSKRNEIREAMQRRVKRFSPFELLGLDEKPTSSSSSLPDPLSPPSESLAVASSVANTPQRSDISDRLTYPQTVPSDVPSDRLMYPQTVPSDVPSDPHLSDPLIQGLSDSTKSQVITLKNESPEPSREPPFASSIPLAPLQWRVWEVLQNCKGKVVSYQGLASQVQGSIPGIRQAIRIIEREGGILSRITVREKTAEGAVLQGFRVVLNQATSFHAISSQEAHKLQQRQIGQFDVSHGLIQPRSDTSDRLRMYVSNKIHTYMPELLHLCPSDWQIREQTLIKIAETFPTMSGLEFRRSIRYLVEQAKTAKQAIQNPNAWLKAAFERNGGPLVTERMIEAQIDQHGSATKEKRNLSTIEVDPDLEILRRYVAASMEEKATIDRLADERVGRLLETVSADKHEGIREQARIESAREFFSAKRKKIDVPI
jgi:hypothetical protein